MLACGMGPADVAARLRIRPYYAESTIAAAKRIRQEVIQADIRLLADCDAAVKRGRVREDLASDRCLLCLNEV